LINFGLAGALILPSIKQELTGVRAIEKSILATEQGLEQLSAIEEKLAVRDYAAVRLAMAATEAPLGAERERDELLDQLRHEIGKLGAQVERIDASPLLPHLREDPTANLSSINADAIKAPTTGLSEEARNDLGAIWPPVPGTATQVKRSTDDRLVFEEPGFTVDAVLQGRAYYRAGRYGEALTLLRTRVGSPAADYWMGRCFERQGNTREALTAYNAVLNNAQSSATQVDRARRDSEFLQWLVDFDRKIKDVRTTQGGAE
jgi:TolA-binding protein